VTNGPGSVSDSTYSAPSDITEDKTATVELTATDDDGASATDTATVTVTNDNQPPTAHLTVSPDAPTVGQEISLDASESSDPDGSIAEYRWDLTGDGTTDRTTQEPTVTTTVETAGDRDVTVRVIDDDGAQNGATRTVSVVEALPAVTGLSVLAPTNASTATVESSDDSVAVELLVHYDQRVVENGQLVDRQAVDDQLEIAIGGEATTVPSLQAAPGSNSTTVRLSTAVPAPNLSDGWKDLTAEALLEPVCPPGQSCPTVINRYADTSPDAVKYATSGGGTDCTTTRAFRFADEAGTLLDGHTVEYEVIDPTGQALVDGETTTGEATTTQTWHSGATYTLLANASGYEDTETTFVGCEGTQTAVTLSESSPGIVTGVVTDTTNDPIPNTAITVRQNNQIVAETTTTDAGEYSVTVAPGAYTVSGSQSDYATGRASVTVEAGETARGDLVLESQAPTDVGIELQQQAAVANGETATIAVYPTNNAERPVANATLELLVDADRDGAFTPADVVAARGIRLSAGSSRSVDMNYTDVQLSTGEYRYQARLTANGETTTSFTNGTLSVTAADNETDSLDVSVSPRTVMANESTEVTVTATAGGSAVANALISIPTLDQSTITDADGTAEIPVTDGEPTVHAVYANADGYDTATTNLTIQSADTQTTVSLEPTRQTVAVGETVEYDVVVDGIDNGIDSYEFDVASSNTAVATITSLDLAATDSNSLFTDVSVGPDGSSASAAAVVDIPETGRVTLGTVVVDISGTGSATLSLSDVSVDDLDMDTLGPDANATLATANRDPVVVGDQPARDLDGDGTYEDINGDGEFDIVDVNALFQNYDSQAVQNNTDLFDVNGDGTVDLADVNRLFQRLQNRRGN
jgi:hypothetical protein